MRHALVVCVFLALLAACAPVVPSPVPVLTPTSTPLPTPTPAPTPTSTPIPPLVLTIHWPAQVSALQPVDIHVELLPPPGISVTATVRALVLAPRDQVYRSLFNLPPRVENLYAAAEPLRLPLEPEAGDWQLVVYAHSALEVEGERRVTFQPAPIPFRDLTGALPDGVDMRVPEEFTEIASQGDQVAGARVWRYGGGEVSLWWAPGPVEQMTLDDAAVMLETTYEPGAAPQVSGHEEMDWQGQAAFLFEENWPGDEGGPAEALVAQGFDYHLYVLRVRALGGETVSPLLHQVWETFTLGEE